MKKVITLFLIFSFLGVLDSYSQDKYKTESGIVYKIGDTIQLGQPLSHLGWLSIYSEDNKGTYIRNKTLIDEEVVIKTIDTLKNPVTFSFIYYNKLFYIKINDALRNKELIPPLERELSKKEGGKNKYLQIKTLKELLDSGAITKEEFETEKRKILENN